MPGKRKTSQSGPRQPIPKLRAGSLFFAAQPAVDPSRFWIWLSPLLAFVIVVSWCHIRSLDIWWHLQTGAWVMQQRAVPHADPFSESAAGQPWVSHEWLFGLLSYASYLAGGVTGIVAAKSVLVAVAVAASAWIARLRGARPAMTLLVLTASFAISRIRFTERPELISLPLAIGFLLIYEYSRRRPWLLVWIPLLQILWVNIHGGTALLGWGLAGAIALDRALDLHARGISWSGLLRHREAFYPAAALAGVVAFSLANPHGAQVLTYGALRAQSPLDNKEFQSLVQVMSDGTDLASLLFLAFAALLLYMLISHARSVRPYEWILYPALLVLPLVYFRFRPLFAFLLAPTLAWHLSQGRLLSRARGWLPALASLFLMIRVASVEGSTHFYRFGAGIHEGVFPVQAVDFIRQNHMDGRMFNSYGFGGYLIWTLWPERRVFIDGREDVYLGPGILEEYVHCFDSRERWQALVAKYGIDYALVRYPEQPPSSPQKSLETLAFPRHEWALVYFDDVAALYARRNGRNDGVIQKHEIRTVQPFQLSSYLDEVLRDPLKLSAFLAEMDANLRAHPSSFRAHFTLGVLAVKRGQSHLGEALQEFETAAAANPDFVPVHLNLGNLYLGLGRLSEAERCFRKALTLENNAAAAEQLRRIRGRR